MLFFRNREIETKQEIHEIPEDQIEKIIQLIDESEAKNSGRMEKYLLWKAIHEIFPELDIATGDWSIYFQKILKPCIRRNEK